MKTTVTKHIIEKRARGRGKDRSESNDLSCEALLKSPTYAEELEIDLRGADDGEVFKWFLASVLFGARISESIAARTYRAFERYDRLTPGRILEAGWDFLVNPIMREGGYVRYDEKTSREILRNCEQLLSEYGGSLNRLHQAADSPRDLERRLLAFYGVGPVTVNIFLRELRPYWEKADPEALPIVVRLAHDHGIDMEALDRKSLSFVRIEAGLVRLRKTLDGNRRSPGKHG
jgi:endonuclease III